MTSWNPEETCLRHVSRAEHLTEKHRMYDASLITDVLPVLVNRMSFWLQGQGF